MFNTGYSGKDAKAMAAFQTEWLKAYGVWILGWLVATFMTMMIALAATAAMPKRVRVFVALGTLMSMVATLGAGLYVNRRRITLRELETLLPLLELTETQRAYAQTVVALGNMGQSRTEIDETMVALNALLDEESRLLTAREQILGSDHQDERSRLVEERMSLQAKMDAARDAGARSAFEQSIVLLEERLSNLDSHAAHLERIEAHLELLRQAVLATRDAARRLQGGVRAPELATDSLRSAVALARAQTQATEAALAELRAI